MKKGSVMPIPVRISSLSSMPVALRLLAILSCALVPPAVAQTWVGADIQESTTWHHAGSPFTVSGDVSITDNAVLSIEPGVTVFFETDASLHVESGTLSAQGTSAAPIVFTSANDVDGSGVSPAPGDWGVLGFHPGTRDASTVLSNVRVRYGQGIVVEGASPTFNNLHVEYSAGPAIELDLDASPKGRGLEARGNTLNGIRIPSGQISTDIVWSLRGIPYVLEEGVIQIGRPSFALHPEQIQLTTGVVATIELTLPAPAPPGGLAVDIVSSVPSVLSAPNTLIVPEASQSEYVQIEAMGQGASVLSASAAGFGTVTSAVRVIEPPKLSLSPRQAVISIQGGGTLELVISDVAPAGGRTIHLATDPPGLIAVPAQVSIPAGSSNALVSVDGLAHGTATLSAAATGYFGDSSTVTVRPVSLNLPDTLVVAPGQVRSMPILLTDPAPAGGLEVMLQSSDPSIANAPVSVQIDAGNASANIDVEGLAQGSAQLVANAAGYEPDETLVQVESITIDLSPAGTIKVPEGLGAERSVRLSKPAPSGGAWIDVETLDASVATATPERLFVPEGQTLATSSLTLQGKSTGTTELQLHSPGLIPSQIAVNVGPRAHLEFSRTDVVVGHGLNTHIHNVYVRRRSGNSNYAASTPLDVTLLSADPGKAGVPSTVTIPAGQYQATFQVSGHALTTEPVAINASAQGYTPSQTPLMATAITPSLVFQHLDGTRGIGGVNDNFRVYWNVPGASYSTSQTAIDDQTFALSIVDPTPEGIVDGFLDRYDEPTTEVRIAAGRNDSYYSFGQQDRYVTSPTSAGTYRVRAELSGIGSWHSAQQTVAGAELVFSRSDVVVGHGLQTHVYNVYVQLRAAGKDAPTATPLDVAITSENPAVAGVPSKVTIPAGQYQATFQVSGHALTTEPVAINASAQGYTPSQTPLMATVVTPSLVFQHLDGTRGIGGVNDNFRVYWNVPGASYSTSQTAIDDQTFALSIVDPTPEGIVDGFLDRHGEPTTEVRIAAGRNDSYYSFGQQDRYVTSPTSAGTYRVRAELSGIGSWHSAQQTVAGAEFVFSRGDVVVGHGLQTHVYNVYVQLKAAGKNAPTATPLDVAIISENPAEAGVPSNVTIPAGQYQATFQVSGHALTTEPVAINASAQGYTPSQTPLMATVVTPSLVFQYLDGTRGIGGVNDNFRVYWHVPGASYSPSQTAIDDQTFALSIVDPTPEGIVDGFLDRHGEPTTEVRIAAGRNDSYGSFGQQDRYVTQPMSAGTYRVAAELSGVGSWRSANQMVAAPELRFSRNSVTVGMGMNTYLNEVYVRRTVNGVAFYGATDVSVSLSCTSMAVCAVPSHVTIPAGQHQSAFRITGIGTGAARVIPEATGYLGLQDLDVTTILPQLQLSGVPGTLQVGATTNVSMTLRAPGAAYADNQTAAVPISIDLTSAQPSVATLPAQAIVAPGSRTVSASLSATGPGSTTITASGLNLVPVTSNLITVPQP